MRRTKQEAEQTKEAILRSAIYLFSSKGVAKTSIDEIAKDARVTRGAVYWHFKNKTEIFDALFEALHKSFIETVWDEFDKNDPNPLEQLKNICTEILLKLKTDEEKVLSLIIFLQKCDYSGELEVFRQRHIIKKKEKFEAFHKFFLRAKELGQLPTNTDCDLLTRGISMYMKGIVLEFLDERDTSILDKVPGLMDLYFKNFK